MAIDIFRLKLYAFFWVIPQRPNFMCGCFGTLCLFRLRRWVGTYLPMKTHKIQTPGNRPEESVQHSEHGKSLKSRTN